MAGPGIRSELSRRLARVAAFLAFVAFAGFLVFQLREGLNARPADEVAAPPAEPEDVESRAIRFTQLDEAGAPLLEVSAEEALGRSDGTQRFLGVSVRFFDTHESGDTVISADELVVDARNEGLEFIGNARLESEELELESRTLQFRRTPDRLWSREDTSFRTEEFVGEAESFQFELDSGEVRMSEVRAEPVEEGGLSASAGRIHFLRSPRTTALYRDVRLASDRYELTSQQEVVLTRLAGGAVRILESGFGTRIAVFDEDPPEDAAAPPVSEGAGDGEEPAAAAGGSDGVEPEVAAGDESAAKVAAAAGGSDGGEPEAEAGDESAAKVAVADSGSDGVEPEVAAVDESVAKVAAAGGGSDVGEPEAETGDEVAANVPAADAGEPEEAAGNGAGRDLGDEIGEGEAAGTVEEDAGAMGDGDADPAADILVDAIVDALVGAEQDESDERTPTIVIHGDAVGIGLASGQRIHEIAIHRNPLIFGQNGTELRGDRARLSFEDGLPRSLEMTGSAKSDVALLDPDSPWIEIEAESARFEFDGSVVGSARWEGGVVMNQGSASGSAAEVVWDGGETFALAGAARMVDSSFLELQADAIRLQVDPTLSISAEGGVAAEFLPEGAAFLPGGLDQPVVAGNARMVAGERLARFGGGVRLGFGGNLLSAGEIEVDAGVGRLVASSNVISTMTLGSEEGAADVPADADGTGSAAAGSADSPAEGARVSTGEENAPDSPSEAAPVASVEDAGSPAAEEEGATAVSVTAGGLRFDGSDRLVSWYGEPRLTERSGDGPPTSLAGVRLDARLGAAGAVREITGEGGARFERGESWASGSRIRYRAGSDELDVEGAPAVVVDAGRRAEGGRLFVALGRDRLIVSRSARVRARTTASGRARD